MNKKELRAYIRREKSMFSPETLAFLSESICKQVLTHPKWSMARTVLLYASLPDEVHTERLITQAIHEKKQVLLPVVCGELLELKRYSSRQTIGQYGISEPVGKPFLHYEDIDLAIIPGMAFDPEGHRLGRGKGYYDRLLPHVQAYKIGICFPFQLLEQIPVESQDIAMDEVIA